MDRLRILIFSIIVWPIFSFAGQKEIVRLNLIESNHSTLAIFQAEQPFQFHRFLLTNPSRFVVDLPQVKIHASNAVKTFASMAIKNIRWSNHSSNMMRVVFDLNDPHAISTSIVTHLNKYQVEIKFVSLSVQSSGVGSPKENARSPKPEAMHSKESIAKKSILITPKVNAEVAAVDEPSRHNSEVIVVIDAGHGGKDPGATGLHGTQEKDIVLLISKDLQNIINQQPGFKALLTRNADYYLTLRQRLAVAREDNADLFIAIHADTYQTHNAHGASVFALSERGATSEAARWLATRENESELMGGVSLTDKGELLKSVLISLSQTATIRSSLEIGGNLIASLSKLTVLHHYRVEQAAFVVLKSPDIPSLLVETGFLSNPYEEQNLRDYHYRHRLAMAICSGIVRYFQHAPPPGTWLARRKFGHQPYA